ncbi:hypothetical protein RhiirB3_444501 [Rhizophagus irregularis]|nr:hypothetical protein RhiirB3_444501 [Rhizophagus irregularis]
MAPHHQYKGDTSDDTKELKHQPNKRTTLHHKEYHLKQNGCLDSAKRIKVIYIPDLMTEVDDFGKSSNQNTSKMSGIIEDNQSDYNKKIVLTQNLNNEDEDEVYNNPNLHSEEQDEFEIPDDGF